MADLTVADIIAARPALPYVSPEGETVTVFRGRIFLTSREITGSSALELSAALARAATDVGELRAGGNPNHTTRTEANHGC
ncbi:hypothetical protein [Micromonospora sp. NPDC005174]|uniref:hypothetical protein n=1 Tax=Micromonospora sp. NPDC005174 TaxID=3157018 RepID=UPI0033AFFB64